MNTNRLFRTIITMVFSILVLGTAAFAQGGRGEKLAQQLNLTQEQRDKLKQDREQFKAKHAQEISDVKALREKLREYQKNGDKANAQATREQLKTKTAALGQEMKSESSAVLTPDQQAQLEKLRAERKEKIQERRQNRKQNG